MRSLLDWFLIRAAQPRYVVVDRMLGIERSICEVLGIPSYSSARWTPHPARPDLGRDIWRSGGLDVSELAFLLYKEDDALSDTKAAMLRNMRLLKKVAVRKYSSRDPHAPNYMVQSLEKLEADEGLDESPAYADPDWWLFRLFVRQCAVPVALIVGALWVRVGLPEVFVYREMELYWWFMFGVVSLWLLWIVMVFVSNAVRVRDAARGGAAVIRVSGLW